MVQDFFGSYLSELWHQQEKRTEFYLIEMVQLFLKADPIKDRFEIISKGRPYPEKELTLHNILERFVSYEKLNL